MKTVAIIPSRYESSRFPGKPLHPIGGKPMIQHVYEKTAAAAGVDAVAVATDDSRIVDAVSGFGGRAIMTSDHHRSGTDRVAEAADAMGCRDEDIVINVQGDQPAMEPRCLAAMVTPLLDDSDLCMTTLAFRIVTHREVSDPKDVKVVMDHRMNALYFSRSTIPYNRDPDTEPDYYKHLGFYAYRRQFLETFRSLPESRLERIEKLEQLRALENGYAIRVVLSPFDSPEVDLPEDIPRIEAYLGR